MGYICHQQPLDPIDAMDCFQLWYDEKRNIMMDEGGFPVFNVFYYITPNQFYLFRAMKEYMIVQSKLGPWVELIWPEHDES